MKYLKVTCENVVDATPEVVKWNSWDGEHLKVVHKAYSNPKLLYSRPGFGLLVDAFKMPLLGIKLRSLVFTVQDSDESQVSYTQTPFFLAKNSITLVKLSEKKTLVKVNYEFEAGFLVSIFFPIIKRYIIKWNDTVWQEDLPLKIRRQKALEYGFVDFVGLPSKIENRVDKSLTYKCEIPVTRTSGLTEDDHVFLIKSTKALV